MARPCEPKRDGRDDPRRLWRLPGHDEHGAIRAGSPLACISHPPCGPALLLGRGTYGRRAAQLIIPIPLFAPPPYPPRRKGNTARVRKGLEPIPPPNQRVTGNL